MIGSYDIGTVPSTTVLWVQIQPRHRLPRRQRHGQLQLCVPLVAVFTHWYRAMRLDTEPAYRKAADLLEGAGMPGLQEGLLPLALACHHVRHALPVPDADYGPYEPWTGPLVLLSEGRRAEAAAALHVTPEPPPGLLLEALWCLTAHAAKALDHQQPLTRARAALAPAATEQAGAGSGLLTLGPIAAYL